MPKVLFVAADGSRREVMGANGISLMESARANGIEGILAQCGGACACATCHVYVASAWMSRLPPPDDMEEAMLELAWERRASSRLSCQIMLDTALDGLEVELPARQSGE